METLAIGQTGLITLNEGIEKMSPKKQKAVIVDNCRDLIIQVTEAMSEINAARAEEKQLTEWLARTKEGKRLKALKSIQRNQKKASDTLLQQYAGMLKLATALGFNVTDELKKMERING
jgi:PAS domain-containing protein